VREHIDAKPVKLEGEPIIFTTLNRDPAPRTVHVAPDGDNDNSGLDRKNALRTIPFAADSVHVADTVLIGGGTYKERLRIRVTGEAGAPITFKLGVPRCETTASSCVASRPTV